MSKIIEQIPSWALCYLINADASGLTDEEISEVDNYCEHNNIGLVCPINNSIEEELQPYFTPFPAFGKACDVIDCIVLCNKSGVITSIFPSNTSFSVTASGQLPEAKKPVDRTSQQALLLGTPISQSINQGKSSFVLTDRTPASALR